MTPARGRRGGPGGKLPRPHPCRASWLGPGGHGALLTDPHVGSGPHGSDGGGPPQSDGTGSRPLQVPHAERTAAEQQWLRPLPASQPGRDQRSLCSRGLCGPKDAVAPGARAHTTGTHTQGLRLCSPTLGAPALGHGPHRPQTCPGPFADGQREPLLGRRPASFPPDVIVTAGSSADSVLRRRAAAGGLRTAPAPGSHSPAEQLTAGACV